jgi:hypothetical protein
MKTTLRLRVRVSWWLRYYLLVLEVFCDVFDREPDWQKLSAVIELAIRIEADVVKATIKV